MVVGNTVKVPVWEDRTSGAVYEMSHSGCWVL